MSPCMASKTSAMLSEVSTKDGAMSCFASKGESQLFYRNPATYRYDWMLYASSLVLLYVMAQDGFIVTQDGILGRDTQPIIAASSGHTPHRRKPPYRISICRYRHNQSLITFSPYALFVHLTSILMTTTCTVQYTTINPASNSFTAHLFAQ